MNCELAWGAQEQQELLFSRLSAAVLWHDQSSLRLHLECVALQCMILILGHQQLHGATLSQIGPHFMILIAGIRYPRDS